MPIDTVPWEPAPERTLVSNVRPVVGGIQIQSSMGTCTFGFNVRRFNSNGTSDIRRFFMTNSHCTGDDLASGFGKNNNLVMGQPSTDDPIGVEEIDPPVFDSNQSSACPRDPGSNLTRYCRYSDAALFQLYGSVEWAHGEIADVGFATSGNAAIWGTVMMNGQTYALDGETVGKVGRTTGYSNVRVTATCADLPMIIRRNGRDVDSGITLLCQKQALYNSDEGDSGSPVYLSYAYGYRDAVGIHWGRNRVTGEAAFSSLGFAFWEFDQATGGSGSRYLASQTNLSHR
jgi:hypothetical protein